MLVLIFLFCYYFLLLALLDSVFCGMLFGWRENVGKLEKIDVCQIRTLLKLGLRKLEIYNRLDCFCGLSE